MAVSLNTCKVLSQLIKQQARKATLLNRGWVYLSTTSLRQGGYAVDDHGGEYQPLPIKTGIGKREVVGFGLNGEESYTDTTFAPFPAIRFKEDTPEILKIREKEKGDWKKMTVVEKKELYRASFAQTFVELEAPTGEWKPILGISLIFISLGIWAFIWLTTYAYDELPLSMTDDEYQKKQLERIIDMRQNPVTGIASHYDYEKDQWKSMP